MVANRKQPTAKIKKLEKRVRELEKKFHEAEAKNRALKDSQSRYMDVFQCGMMGAIFWNAKGDITDANDTFLKMLGYARNDVLSGKVRWSDMTPKEYKEKDKALLKELARTGKIAPYEKEYIHKDGRRIPIMLGAATFSGSKTSGVAFVLDIKERKEVEEKLKENEDKYYTLIDKLGVGVVLHAPDTSVLLSNPKASEILGLSSIQMKGKKAIDPRWKFVIKDGTDMPLEEYPVNKVIKSRKPLSEYLLGVKRPDRKYITWVSVNASLVFDKNNKVKYATISFRDITERKRFKSENVHQRQLLESVGDYSKIGGWEMDLATGKATWTKATYAIVEIKQGSPVPEFKEHISWYLPEYRNMVKKTMNALVRTGKPMMYKAPFKTKKGRIKWGEARGWCVVEKGKMIKIRGTFQDITAVKVTEQELRNSEKKYRLLVENIPQSIFLKDKNLVYVSANKRFCDDAGIKEKDIIGKTDYDLFTKELADRYRKNDRQIIRHGKKETYEEPYIGADGVERLVYTTKAPAKNDKGNPDGVMGIYWDITERIQMEHALKKERYYLKKAQEIGHIGAWELDMGANELVWSDQVYRIFGMRLGIPITYESFLGCVHPYDREYVDRERKAALKKKPYRIEYRILVNGSVKWVTEEAEWTYDNKGKAIEAIGFIQDITDRKSIEVMKDSLIRDVSHSVKTPLSNARMACDIVQDGIARKDSDVAKKGHEIVLENIIKAYQDVENILRISFIEENFVTGVKKEVSLSETVENVVNVSIRSIKAKNLTVKTNIRKGADRIFVNPSHFRLVLDNLLNNAIKFTDKGWIKISTCSKGSNIVIKMTDTGCGMAPNTRKKVFDKFFKRQAAVGGIGLGLSICKGFIEKWNGQIHVESKGIGKGTSVIVTLPKNK